MHQQNDFEKNAQRYNKSDEKPDKKYSILPTVLSLAGDCTAKTIVDLGCGDGFFTRAFLQKNPKHIIGIDNSSGQISLAKKMTTVKNITYKEDDIFTMRLPAYDVICAPFVLNYATHKTDLKNLLQRCYDSLSTHGVFIGVLDLPDGNDTKKFGAQKHVPEKRDGSPITINLYDENKRFICTLYSTYYTKETITTLLTYVGFKNITWHQPIISPEGIKKFGNKFWQHYPDMCELGYVTAKK